MKPIDAIHGNVYHKTFLIEPSCEEGGYLGLVFNDQNFHRSLPVAGE